MKRLSSFLPILLFLFLTIFLFRQYVFLGKVPFPGNLLVSFYAPWKTYTWGNYGANGPANKPIGFDSLRIFYPLRSLTVDSLKHFSLPLWNPYDFGGNTQLATYQSAVFFPLTPLFLMLPQIQAWSLVVVLEPFLVSLFTYLFLRSLKLSKISSTLGGLSFGFSVGVIVLSEESFMAVYSLMFLPLILLGLQIFFSNGKFRWFALFSLSITGSILSGWFQSTLYVLFLSFAWLVFLFAKTKNKKIFFLSLAGILTAFLLAAPHLVPNMESYFYSARGTTDAKFLFDMYLLKPWELITYFAPDFYGNPGTYNYFGTGFFYERVLSIGVVGLFFGLITFFRNGKTHEEWFFSLFWILTVSLGISLPTSWFILYTLHLPFISTILPSRIFLLSAFCLSVLSAFGLEAFLRKPTKKSYAITLALFIVVFFAAFVFLLWQKENHPFSEFVQISLKNVILPVVLSIATSIGAFFLFFKARVIKKIGLFLLFLVSISSIIYFSNKYLFFSDKSFTFPSSPVLSKLQEIAGNNRIWSFGKGYIDRNFATYYHLQSPEGYDSFYIQKFGELIAASKNNGSFTKETPRADAQLTAVSRLSEVAKNASLMKMLNLLGVKYLAAYPASDDTQFVATDPTKTFVPVWQDGKYILYSNTHAYPRAFLVRQYVVIQNQSEQMAAIFSPRTDLSKTIILNTDPHMRASKTPLQGSVHVVSYAPEKVVIQIATNTEALLFLSDNNYPGWKAFVDGQATPILTADYTFRSVVVPQGKHTVIFVYQPVSVAIGFAFCFVGILLFLFFFFTIQ